MSRFDIAFGIAVGAILATIAVAEIGLEPLPVMVAATVPFTAIGVFLVLLESMSETGGQTETR